MFLWDARRFCQDFAIPYVLAGETGSGKVTEGWVGVQCPNPSCNSQDKADYGGFNIAKGYYSCWVCGGHSLPQVIRWLLKVNYSEAKEIIWQYTGTGQVVNSLNNKEKETKKVKEIEMIGGAFKMSHWKYLEGRGFDPDYIIEKYNLKAVGRRGATFIEAKYINRIIIPIYDRQGRLVSYQGRDTTGLSKIRYKGCKLENSAMNYKHLLYGWQFANLERCGIVEGVFDQWAMGDGFLATFGTGVTEQQVREMAMFKRIFILFDSEAPAQAKANKIANKLASLGREVEVVNIGGERDPAELSREDRSYIRKELGFNYEKSRYK